MKCPAFWKHQKGFSTIELMIALTVTTAFAASFYGAFQVMNNGMWSAKVYFDTNNSVKGAMDRMARDVEEAIQVETSHTFNGTVENTGTGCLILRLPSIDNAGIPTSISAQFDYVMYKLNAVDSTLRRSVDILDGTSQRNSGADVNSTVVAKKVIALVFCNPANNDTVLTQEAAGTITAMKYLNAQITAQGKTLHQNESTTVDSDMMLRNKIN